jgi:hypothetical protein
MVFMIFFVGNETRVGGKKAQPCDAKKGPRRMDGRTAAAQASPVQLHHYQDQA